MKRILSQCRKELAQFRRDRLSLALAFLLPLITLIIFGFVIRLESKNIPLFIQDFDNSPLSRSYIERLFATNQFEHIHNSRFPFFPAKESPEIRNPQTAIDQGLAKASIVIPPDFSRRIKSGLSTDVQVIVDGTDVNNARIIKNSIQATTIFFLRDSGLQPAFDKIITHIRLWFNPGRKESLYIVPGIYAVILWILSLIINSSCYGTRKRKRHNLTSLRLQSHCRRIAIREGFSFPTNWHLYSHSYYAD